MKFLSYNAGDSPESVREKHGLYLDYLRENQKLFPLASYEFATVDWHYDPTDHRCPHDSWVQGLEIIERHEGSRQQYRSIDMILTMLGAYHDGNLRLTYRDVNSYSLNLAPDAVKQPKFHGDLLIDEVRLSEAKYVLHEIRFWRDGVWLIECRELRYEWIPFAPQSESG